MSLGDNGGHSRLDWKVLVSPSQVGHQDLASVPHVKDLDSAVGRAGGQSGAVVVHLGVVLRGKGDRLENLTNELLLSARYFLCDEVDVKKVSDTLTTD